MIELRPLASSDREQFIKDNQEAFNFGALEEFGRRDDHFEEEGEIISRGTVEASIDGGEACRIMQDGRPVGGVVIKVEGGHGDTCCSSPRKYTVKVSAILRGAQLRGFIRR